MLTNGSKIEVVEIRLHEGRSSRLKGFVDIRVGNWEIRDFRIEQDAGNRLTVTSPVSSWWDPTMGKRRFKGIVSMSAEERQLLEIAVLGAYQQAREEKDGSQPQRANQ